MIVSRDHARRLIAAHYPGVKFRITASRVTMGVRVVTDPRPTLAWQSLTRGEDSAVRIGILRPDNRLRTVDTEPGVEAYRR